jgi:hypothetical protein
VNKNDPGDARSVAIAALRSAGVQQVRPDDHVAVLKIWSKRYRDLGRTRTQDVCRLHAALGELIPGGVPKASPRLAPPDLAGGQAGRGSADGPLRPGRGPP